MSASDLNLLDPRHHSHFEFLRTELELGITFAEIAQTGASEATAKRNRQKARDAYDKALLRIKQIRITPEELATLRDLLESLKAKLVSVGDTFI